MPIPFLFPLNNPYARLEVGIAHRRRVDEGSRLRNEPVIITLNGLIHVAPVGDAHL